MSEICGNHKKNTKVVESQTIKARSYQIRRLIHPHLGPKKRGRNGNSEVRKELASSSSMAEEREELAWGVRRIAESREEGIHGFARR